MDRDRKETVRDVDHTFGAFVGFFREAHADRALLDGVECRRSYADYFFDYYRATFGPGSPELGRRHRKWLARMRPILDLPRMGAP